MDKYDLIRSLQDEILFLQETKLNLDHYEFTIKGDGELTRRI